MKNKLNMLNKMKWLLTCAVLIVATSCKKALDINTDPNKALNATPQLVLPAAQVELGLTIGNTFDFVGSMWAQYWTGGHGVSTSLLEYYTMQSVDVESGWTRAYARAMKDFNYLTKSEEPIYSGIAKICSAYEFQMLTDLFGDIPMADAMKGDEGVFTPTFNTTQEVYDALIPLIDEGITEVQSTDPGIATPGADDLMYGGDLDKWIAFANTLKLKVLIRRGDYAAAKTLVQSGVPFIDAETDNAQISWAETSQNTNPIWARFQARTGIEMYYVATTTIIDKLEALSDPRIDFLFKKPSKPAANSPHKGVIAGDVNTDPQYLPPNYSGTDVERRANFSQPSALVFGPTIPTYFMTAWESKFLQAEALIRNGDNADALFEEAVQLSFDHLGAGSATAYLATLGFSGSSMDDQLDILAIQKWISMTSSQMAESWLETLRFNRPGHEIFTSGTYTSPSLNSLGAFKFPTSFVYPTQEVALNSNTPSRTVTDKRFWDN
ncbi:MAG: SusD/RagB family nutrient-binding outer membrane lipoprotein [Bacteroidetes bacterium]|nr:SusD/RagB family nutrient-binding outer membrane lipoprotein [Bacteroidota bacterium]